MELLDSHAPRAANPRAVGRGLHRAPLPPGAYWPDCLGRKADWSLVPDRVQAGCSSLSAGGLDVAELLARPRPGWAAPQDSGETDGNAPCTTLITFSLTASNSRVGGPRSRQL